MTLNSEYFGDMYYTTIVGHTVIGSTEHWATGNLDFAKVLHLSDISVHFS